MKKKVWLILLIVILVIGAITAVFVIRDNRNKADTYQKAVQMAQTGNTTDAYRLFREPRRMWRRYLVGNPLFAWNVLKEYLCS